MSTECQVAQIWRDVWVSVGKMRAKIFEMHDEYVFAWIIISLVPKYEWENERLLNVIHKETHIKPTHFISKPAP